MALNMGKEGVLITVLKFAGIWEYPEHTICDIRTFKIDGISVTCCS